MQAKFRYLALSTAVVTAIAILSLLIRTSYRRPRHDRPRRSLPSRLDDEALWERDIHESTQARRQAKAHDNQGDMCSMQSCFNYSRCAQGFKVFVYDAITDLPVSTKYEEILNSIRQSKYYTNNASEACLFVLSIDTLDRDKLSHEFVHNVDEKLRDLTLWNNGENHIIFNLYSGTWPDYSAQQLGFDYGKAILAKASVPHKHYRQGFDISLPLFHKEHPLKGGDPGYLTSNNVPPVRQYTLSFKGKRYLHGIGSESRNALYHIHNGQDIILLTTCKHQNTPKHLYDERCDQDDEEYEKWDYKVLMHNSTFCLVPRGRRLASYRFLESLQAACVPVLLSNEYVLPFDEVIDWSRASISADERLLLQIPSLVRSVTHTDILSLRQQTQFLWQIYFSSTEKIVLTSLEILAERVASHWSLPVRCAHVWNTYPGALATLPQYSPLLTDYPFYVTPPSALLHAAPSPPTDARQLAVTSGEYHYYTALIHASASPTLHPNSALYRLIKNLIKSNYLYQIVILWRGSEPAPDARRWQRNDGPSIDIRVIDVTSGGGAELWREIDTQAVLSLHEDVSFSAEEADFGFHVWQHFPARLVGYESRSHFWAESEARWRYTSKPTHAYSMVLATSAFYHKYYIYAYHSVLSGSASLRRHHHHHHGGGDADVIMDDDDPHSTLCHSILLNVLVSHVTQQPPLKLAQHKAPPQPPLRHGASAAAADVTTSLRHFEARQRCLNAYVTHFGYMPLQRSELRLDPVLFKDPVSITRKKYRQLEKSPSGSVAAPPPPPPAPPQQRPRGL